MLALELLPSNKQCLTDAFHGAIGKLNHLLLLLDLSWLFFGSHGRREENDNISFKLMVIKNTIKHGTDKTGTVLESK